MNKKLLISGLIAPLCLVFLLNSCKNGQQTSDDQEKKGQDTSTHQSDTSSQTDTISQEAKTKFKLVILNNIPSPVEILSDVEKTKVKFRPKLVYTTEEANKYVTTHEKALLLGIYNADLGYLTINDQTQAAVHYFKMNQKMANGIGAGKVFNPKMLDKFNKHLGNKDSLMQHIYSTYDKIFNYLRSNQRLKTAITILAGGWIESLYISTQTVKGYSRSEVSLLYKRTWEQKIALRNILKLLKKFKDDPECSKLAGSLKEIYNVYKPIKYPSALTTEKMKTLRQKITQLRQKLLIQENSSA